MSRPLAWLLALAVAAVIVLLIVVPRASNESAPPDPDTVRAHGTSTRATGIELASVPEGDARPEAESSEPDAAGTRASALRIPEGAIEVRVVREEDGAPIEGADVVIAPPGPWDHIRPVKTADDGTIVQTGTSPDTWIVRAVAANRSERVEFVTLTAAEPRASVLLKLPIAKVIRSITVRIVDVVGQPAAMQAIGAGALMSMRLGVLVQPDCAPIGTELRNSGPEHTFATRDLSLPGLQWTIQLQAGSYACVHLMLRGRVMASHELLPSENLVDFLLSELDLEHAKGTADVRLVDHEQDTPVVGAMVMVTLAEGAMFHLTSDAEGRIALGQQPAGKLVLAVHSKDYAQEQYVVAIPSLTPVVIRLQTPRRLQGVVADLSGVPIADAHVIVRRTVEEIVGTSRGIIYCVESGPDGRFEFTKLPRRKVYVSVVRGKEMASFQRDTGGNGSGEMSVTGFALPTDAIVGLETVDLSHGDARGIVLRVDRSKL